MNDVTLRAHLRRTEALEIQISRERSTAVRVRLLKKQRDALERVRDYLKGMINAE